MLKFWKICRVGALVVAPCLVAVSTGCGFFPPLDKCTSNCPAASTNFIYVANSSNTTASPASVAGFSLTTTTTAASGTTPASSTLTLAVTPGSAYQLGYVPRAIAITPNNKFLYVAGFAGGIYLYAINTDGSITLQNNSQPVLTGILASAMKVDVSGAWLVVTSLSTAVTNAQVAAYSIASSTGLLTLSTPGATTIGVAGASNRMAIAPNNINIFVTLGAAGTASLTFNATNGAVTYQATLKTLSTVNGDVGVTSDPSSVYAFITETGTAGVRVLSIGTNGALSEVSGSPFATGTGPTGVLVDSTGAYVYVTNKTSNTISAFTLSAATGILTPIAGSPFTTGITPVDIAEDSTDTYVGVVCNGGNQDLEVYSFDATTLGKLDSAANATTGTDPTLAIAIVATQGT